MKTCVENKGGRYATALDCAMPIYLRIAQFELMEIFEWADTGTAPCDRLADNGEQWLRSAYGQLKAAGELADKWLQMDTQTLLTQKIAGLDDLSLAVYASIVQDRDYELDITNSSMSRSKKMCAAFGLLMDNPRGTFLLDYSWLYSDILEYRLVADDDAYWQAQRLALAFDLRYGPSDRIQQRLISRVHDEITEGDLDRGVRWLALLIENWPATFDVYDFGATALFTAGQKSLGNEVLFSAGNLEMDGETQHFYEDLCFMYNMKPQKMRPKSQLEKRIARALAHPLPTSSRLTAAELLESFFPNIRTVPVKQISQGQPGQCDALIHFDEQNKEAV